MCAALSKRQALNSSFGAGTEMMGLLDWGLQRLGLSFELREIQRSSALCILFEHPGGLGGPRAGPRRQCGEC
eukprot:8928003-Pyramimonas_sp.AAC.1